jgi:hypothetical protein
MKLKISSVGYAPIDLAVDYSDSKTTNKDLGAIKLDDDNRKLDEVTVTGRKALLEMDIDKKVFNVEKISLQLAVLRSMYSAICLLYK